MNQVRWQKHRAEIDRQIESGELPEPERGIRPGDLRGVLQWTDESGQVRRWTIRYSKRINSIRIDGVPTEHGFTWLLDKLRRKIRL